MHSLKVAGGIILFLFALKMIFGGLDSEPGLPKQAVTWQCFRSQCLRSQGQARSWR